MTIEQYIQKLEEMIGENLTWTEEMVGDKEVYYIRKETKLIAVLKESIDTLQEHSFETSAHVYHTALIL